MSIRNLFCHVDDFCQWLMTWENARQLGVTRKRGPAPRLSLSEVMTVLIHFHQSHYRDFKAYDTQHVCKHMRSECPALVSLSQAPFEQRFARGLQLMTAARPLPNTPIGKNMQNRLVLLEDKMLTRKRFVIETIVDQLRNISQIEHTRHRSTTNFIDTPVAGLIACTWQASKPSLNLTQNEMALLPALI